MHYPKLCELFYLTLLMKKFHCFRKSSSICYMKCWKIVHIMSFDHFIGIFNDQLYGKNYCYKHLDVDQTELFHWSKVDFRRRPSMLSTLLTSIITDVFLTPWYKYFDLIMATISREIVYVVTHTPQTLWRASFQTLWRGSFFSISSEIKCPLDTPFRRGGANSIKLLSRCCVL